MGGSATAPPPPDTSRFSDEAMSQATQMRGWAEEMWETGQQEWGRLQEWSSSVMGATLPAMEESFSWAREQRDRFDEYVMPQMQSLFSDAETYASKGEEDRQRGAAIQDVKSATEAQRASHLRKLESYGADPTELRMNSMDRQAGVTEAAMSALAANKAGERTKAIGRELRQDAINVGTGFLSDANAANQFGASAGSTALGAAGNAAMAGSNVSQGALPFMSGAQSGVELGAGIVDTSYGRELESAADQRYAAQQDFDMMSGMMSGGMNMMSGGLTGMASAAAGSKGMGFLTGAMGGAGGGADGGPVAAPGGPTDDAGALRISDGEYIVPADVVRRLGTNHFDKMIEKETGRPPPSVKQAIPVGAV